jgi:hypothetical protein
VLPSDQRQGLFFDWRLVPDDIANVAQDFKSLRQVLRLNDDGSVPRTIVGREGYRPEIYTLPLQHARPDLTPGHRPDGSTKWPQWWR